MWNNAAAALNSPLAVSTPIGKFRELGERSRLVELSSSENSVSIEASHSEDEIQQVKNFYFDLEILAQADLLLLANFHCKNRFKMLKLVSAIANTTCNPWSEIDGR